MCGRERRVQFWERESCLHFPFQSKTSYFRFLLQPSSLLMFFPCRAEWLRGRLPSQATLPLLLPVSVQNPEPCLTLWSVSAEWWWDRKACRCCFSGYFLTALTHQAINHQKKSTVVLSSISSSSSSSSSSRMTGTVTLSITVLNQMMMLNSSCQLILSGFSI